METDGKAIAAALNDYNSLLRSCYAVAKRNGADTNWEPLRRQLFAALDKHHGTWLEVCTNDE